MCGGWCDLEGLRYEHVNFLIEILTELETANSTEKVLKEQLLTGLKHQVPMI